MKGQDSGWHKPYTFKNLFVWEQIENMKKQKRMSEKEHVRTNKMQIDGKEYDINRIILREMRRAGSLREGRELFTEGEERQKRNELFRMKSDPDRVVSKKKVNAEKYEELLAIKLALLEQEEEDNSKSGCLTNQLKKYNKVSKDLTTPKMSPSKRNTSFKALPPDSMKFMNDVRSKMRERRHSSKLGLY